MPRSVRRTRSRRRVRSTRRSSRRSTRRVRRGRHVRRPYRRGGMRTGRFPTIMPQFAKIKFLYRDSVSRGWAYSSTNFHATTYVLNSLWKRNTGASAIEAIPTVGEWSAFYDVFRVNAVKINVQFVNDTDVPVQVFIYCLPQSGTPLTTWASIDEIESGVNRKYIRHMVLPPTGTTGAFKRLSMFVKLADLNSNRAFWNSDENADQLLPPTANPTAVCNAQVGTISMSGSTITGTVYATVTHTIYGTLKRAQVEIN